MKLDEEINKNYTTIIKALGQHKEIVSAYKQWKHNEISDFGLCQLIDNILGEKNERFKNE